MKMALPMAMKNEAVPSSCWNVARQREKAKTKNATRSPASAAIFPTPPIVAQILIPSRPNLA